MKANVIPGAKHVLLVVAATVALPPARGAAEPAAEIVAIVVTNNRSHSLDRPDLQYADDDGARYYRLFAAAAPPANVFLLTTFDRATNAVYPDLVPMVRPPTLPELRTAVDAAAARIANAHRAGRSTVFYFVFAGHGDVDNGTGFLELADGPLDGATLEREVVDRIHADVQHLILDSCNSFFVVNPRRPGGRRWATPRDLALGFAQRHPQVGLFLSTNAESEVYEWSEIESGIFSHEVRSGLAGAADVDGDGLVNYLELAGFVARANAKLPREAMRPQVFYRGPSGNPNAALFAAARLAGRRVTLGPGERRLWVRSADGQRLIDLHKEEAPLTITVPGDPDQEITIAQWHSVHALADRPTITEYTALSGTGPVALAQLQARPASATGRGTDALFGQLFAMPYGPDAYAAFSQSERAPVAEPIYGIRRSDETRMRRYLTEISDSERAQRKVAGYTTAIAGMFVGGIYGYTALSRHDANPSGMWPLGALGGLMVAGGLWQALRISPGERALISFENAIRVPGASRASVMAQTESHLEEMVRKNERTRSLAAGAFLVGAGVASAFGIWEVGWGGPDGVRSGQLGVAWFGGVAALVGFAVLMNDGRMPAEHVLRLYRSDPDLREGDSSLHLDVAPVRGGTTVGVSGRF